MLIHCGWQFRVLVVASNEQVILLDWQPEEGQIRRHSDG
jgi:hypothetical protein